MRLARCRCSNNIIGNPASLQLATQYWLHSFCFFLMGVGGVRGVGSPIYILKALSLIHCNWIDLGHLFIPEQVAVQELEYIDYAVLCQALPPLDLGLTPPNPSGVTVGEVRGVPQGKSRCCYQKSDKWMLVGQKQQIHILKTPLVQIHNTTTFLSSRKLLFS